MMPVYKIFLTEKEHKKESTEKFASAFLKIAVVPMPKGLFHVIVDIKIIVPGSCYHPQPDMEMLRFRI